MQVIDSLISDDLINTGESVQQQPADDSSLPLLELVELARLAQLNTLDDRAELDGIISPTILRRILATLHYRDEATVQHSRRVSRIAVGIAGQLRWDRSDLRRLEIAALLHDIGKIGVPYKILFKPGKLNSEEADLMALHRCAGIEILKSMRVDPQVIRFISQTREFSCGSGRGAFSTPAALHPGAGILSVADAYDSLRTDQVYRKAKSHDEALAILREGSGTRFDSNAITGLAHWADDGGISQAPEYPWPVQPAGGGPALCNPQDARDAQALTRIFSHLSLLENLYDAFYVVDADLRFVVFSGGAERLVGKVAEQALDRAWSRRTICYADEDGRELADHKVPLRRVLESGQPLVTTAKILAAGGRWVDVELRSVPLVDDAGQLHGVAEILRDKSRAHLAHREGCDAPSSEVHDTLTGTLDRAQLRTRLVQMLSDVDEAGWSVPLSVMFINVDRMRRINDRFGRATGDKVLVEIARLLEEETCAGELVGRSRGGEFVILCPAATADQATTKAERIRLAISNMHPAELEDWNLTVSVGVTQAVPGDTVDSVVCRADQALYSAVHAGSNQTFLLPAKDHPEPLLRETGTGLGSRSFELEAQFLASTAAELIACKLGGFVIENKAQVLDVTREMVQMRLGRRGWLRRWGRSDESKAVDIKLELGSELPMRDVNGRKIKSNQIRVTVRIVPAGRVKNRNIFLDRARRVLSDLSAHLLAEM